MHFLVYKTTNLVTGKLYVGTHVTDTLDDGYLGSGTVFRRALNKYGDHNFQRDVIFDCDNAEEMFALEALIVDTLVVADANYYNIKEGGQGGWDHINGREADKRNAAKRGREATDARMKGRYGPDFQRELGKLAWQKSFGSMTPDELSALRKKASDAYFEQHGKHPFEGRQHTEETKARIGAANAENMKGKGNPMYGKMRITDGTENRTIEKTEEIPSGWRRGISRKKLPV